MTKRDRERQDDLQRKLDDAEEQEKWDLVRARAYARARAAQRRDDAAQKVQPT